jgi:hypothetical protein
MLGYYRTTRIHSPRAFWQIGRTEMIESQRERGRERLVGAQAMKKLDSRE